MKILLSLSVLCLAGLFTLGAQEPAKVQVVSPEAGTETSLLRLPARTVAAEEAEIFSRATGIVSERRVDIGDRVKAGDVLAVIEAPEVLRRVDRAKAGVAQATARAELARTALVRAQSMSKNRVISEEVLDERESAAKTAEADLVAARADLAEVEELAGFQTIRAPFDATVAARRIDRGDHIQGDQSQSRQGMFRLVRLNELRVELDAPPSVALKLKPGQKARVEFGEKAGQKFEAVVSRSSGVIDTASGTMRVELTMANADLAIPSGLTGTAFIELAAGEAALLVPTNTVFVRDGKPHVAKVVDGRISFTPVKAGRNFGGKVELLSGVAPGDQLVVSPNALLVEGQPVVAEKREAR